MEILIYKKVLTNYKCSQVIIQCSYQANPSSLRRVKWYHNGQVIDLYLEDFDINMKSSFYHPRALIYQIDNTCYW